MPSYILAHDLGTSGNKATLYDLNGNLKASKVHSYPTLYPFEGAVEHNPQYWWDAVCQSTTALLSSANVSANDIVCVSFSGIMMGCLIVDKEGNPLHNMLIWADTRSAARLTRQQSCCGYATTSQNCTGEPPK